MPATDPYVPFIVGLGGTARVGSTSERAVSVALREAERLGARTRLFDGTFISSLPLYLPERHAETAAVNDFLSAARQCDGFIVATPGYHGSLSGSIKNILDILEETHGDERPYLEGRAFGCIVTACGWQACGTTLVALRTIAHALRAWPTPLGVTLNASAPLFESDGSCRDAVHAGQLALVARQVVEFAQCRLRTPGLTPK